MILEQNIDFFNNLKRILTILIEHEDHLEIEKLFIENIEQDVVDSLVTYRYEGKLPNGHNIEYSGEIYIKDTYFDMSNNEIIQDYVAEYEE